MKNRLRAFTILELLVVLMLGVIVTGIAYSIYSIVIKQYLNQNATNNKNYSITLLSRLMSRDVGNSERVLSTDDGFSCINSNKSPINYKIMNSFIIRDSYHRLDTFHLEELTIRNYFDQKEVMVRDLPVDEILIDGKTQNEPIFLGVQKVYGSNIWMEGR